jgi:hypothetical protein
MKEGTPPKTGMKLQKASSSFQACHAIRQIHRKLKLQDTRREEGFFAAAGTWFI